MKIYYIIGAFDNPNYFTTEFVDPYYTDGVRSFDCPAHTWTRYCEAAKRQSDLYDELHKMMELQNESE